MPTRSHVGWGLGLSLLLHGTGIAALSLALPRVNVRPGMSRQVDFSVLAAPEPAPRPPPREVAAAPVAPEAAASAFAVAATEAPAADVEVDVAQPAAPKVAPKPVPTPKAAPKPPLKAATPSKLPSSVRADPRSDGSALERVLRQIAATSELTQDERRKAMLVVLRTWQDPSAQRSAEELIDALLESARKSRAPSQPASPKLE
jgi:hypothetical protein